MNEIQNMSSAEITLSREMLGEMLEGLHGADRAQGQAEAFMHVAGYAFQLGFERIKWLLQEDHWRLCGFETIEQFADSIQFGPSMRIAAATRKELAILFKEADPDAPISNRKIAGVLNAGHDTINRDLGANAPPAEKKPKENNLLKNGPGANAPLLPSGERGAEIVGTKTHIRGTFGSGENEWYTPAVYLDAAREVLGWIDLDPASSLEANETVRADVIYTADDDGLPRDWCGRVWLNPPYAQPLMSQFVSKLLSEIEAGRVTDAILLTNNYTDTAWFQDAAAWANLICFTRGRIAFDSPHGEKNAPIQGQAFFYFGANVEQFAERFSPFGILVVCRGL